MKTFRSTEVFQGFDFEVQITTPDVTPTDLTVIYVHGQQARNQHRKPKMVCEIATRLNSSFCWYELAGHSNNLEQYDNADLFIWINQLKYLLTNVITGNVVLVGSCLGGIISLFTAPYFKERIKGVITLSAADIDWRQKLSQDQQKDLEKQGYTVFYLQDKRIPFKLTEKFISSTEEIRKQESLTLACPVHLFVGRNDPAVKVTDVLNLSDKISSSETIIKIISNDTHGMRTKTSMTEVEYSLRSILK
jgi:esterase/lipase